MESQQDCSVLPKDSFVAAPSRTVALRVVYGALTILALLVTFLVDVAVAKRMTETSGPLGDLLARGSAVPLLTLTVMLLGGVELLQLTRRLGALPHATFACISVATLVTLPWLSAAGWLGERPSHVEGLYWPLVGLAAAVVGIGILSLARGTPRGIIRDGGATLWVIVLLGFMGSFAMQLRCGRDVAAQQGAWLLLYVILVTKSSDMGAYLVGSACGKHKLVPAISPSKSIEGTIAGLAASGAVAAGLLAVALWAAGSGIIAGTSTGFGNIVGLLGEGGRALYPATSLSPWVLGKAFGLGVLLSAAGQIGDLVESCFKRDAAVKDSGKVIPLFGGILDLVDSLLFALPLGWFAVSERWLVP